jgi:DNA-binding transcriptional MerR regulator
MIATTDSMLTIAQVAAQTGLSRDTLRYYERVGLLDTVPRASGGRRRYSRADLDSLAVLMRLRATGMAIREMRRFADLRRGGPITFPERLALLLDHRSGLQQYIAVLQEHAQALDERIEHYRQVIATQPPARHPDIESAPSHAESAR